MAGRQVAVLTSIRQLFHTGSMAGLDDGQLLERFATRNDESAFAALVALHGPMVLGVCRRILRDGHDVEDAFQATFLVLVKRAGSIRDPGRLGPWLHGVARRVAMRRRAEAGRRRSRQDPSGPPTIAEEPAVRPASRAEGDDVLDVIDEEVARLPARYREAVVLCDLEGRSYAEAARRLSCPLGTLQSRLARGRARLRTRLVSRGVAPLALTAILADGARAAVPEALADATVRAATAGAVSATAAALAGHATRSLLVATSRNLAAALLAVSLAMGRRPAARGGLSAGQTDHPAPAAAIPDPPPPQPEQPPRPDRTLTLRVVDRANSTPLAGATVWVQVTRGTAQASQGRADDEGRFPIALSGDTTYFIYVVAAHPGFVPIEVRFLPGRIPDAYTLALPHGVTIGGTVRDERGRPIAGARVFSALIENGPGGPERYASIGEDVAGVLTDAEGRWQSESLPATAGPTARLNVKFTHPEYLAVQGPITAEEARKRSSIQVMKAGAAITGTVLSPTGRPVAGASVAVQPMGYGWTTRRYQTNGQGQFRTGQFVDPKWAEVMLTVEADGFAWAMRMITISPEIPPQVVTLSPRKPLRGRVVDSKGRPIAGAAVGSTNALHNGHFDWETKTDAEGRFVWYEAPTAGTVLLDVYKAPFVQALGRRVEPGSDEVTITLHRPQHLHGTVTDAETGRPIERFVLIPGWGPGVNARPEWLQGSARPFGAGKFDLPDGLFPDQGFPRSIRIEAEGYEPGELLGFLDNEEDVAHDFKLRRSGPLEGVVRGPDGRPLAGVYVAMSGGDYRARIINGRLVSNLTVREAPNTKTGPDGRFTFRPQGERGAVLATHDAGIAIRSPDELAASTDITLAPWGRIEGVVKIGDRPAPGQDVEALLLEPSSGLVLYDAIADASGRFVLDRVAPGRVEVFRRVQEANHRSITFSNPVRVDVKPGATVRAQVGGVGRPIVGRLVLPEGVLLSNLVISQGGCFSTGRTEPTTPDDYDDWTREQKDDWWDAFYKTPEGRAYIDDRERQYAVDLHPDGTFRIEDVPTGRYVLRLPFDDRTQGYRSGRAYARVDVVVPEIPGGRSDEPLDLGAIPLNVFPFRERKVGDRVPDVIPGGADGRPLDLAAMRGKVVLLAFWSKSALSLRWIARVKETYDAFGRDPQLVIIGLYREESPESMRRYAAHRGLAWEQRYLGTWDAPDPISAAFGVRMPPAIFLIGPDGRIIFGLDGRNFATDPRGDPIKPAVARALESQPPQRSQQGAAEPPRIERMLKLEVVDGTDRSPLAGAAVLVRVTRGQAHTSQGATDDEGRFPIALAGDTTNDLQITVAHPGFVPLEVRWDGSSIPGAYTLALPRGVAIGGVVRDELGRPIAGARVFPRFNAVIGGPVRYAFMGEEIASVPTDADGRWRSEALPVTGGPDGRLDVRFTHPDYCAVESRMTAGEARKRSSIQVMKAGAAIAGTVLSPTGRPVAGATVVVSARYNLGSSARVETDEQGRFRTGHFVDPERPEVTLTAQANGFASAMLRITATPGMSPQVITLSPRKPLRGRVVDSQGKPIPGAAVAANDDFGRGAFDWEAETGADGRFVWFEAPASGSIFLIAYKPRYMPADRRQFEAGSEDVTITLHRPQHLHGTVTDAETGRPIERFTLVEGWGPHDTGGRPEWLQGNRNNKTFTNGRYDIPDGLFPDQGLHRSIRIEADGYEPGEFLGFLDNVEDIAHDFKLRKAAPLTGIVRGPDGRPIAGADVALSNDDNHTRIKNGRLLANLVVGEALHTETGPDGRFRFQPQAKPVSVVAVHDAGFAVRSPEELAASTDITLVPWGRIEGLMKIGNKPAPGQKAAAWLLNQTFYGRVDYEVETDEVGRFTLERVTPGRVEVYRYVNGADHRGWTASNPVIVDVKSGETVRVQVGGAGRPVTGRIALPEGMSLADLVLSHGGNLSTRPSERPTPVDYPDWTDDQRSAWWDAFRKTAEGRAYFATRERHYALSLRPDGAFRIDDVPAGRYVLTLPFEGRSQGDRSGRMAFARVEVVMPEIPGGRKDEPLDIGTIPVEVFAFPELNVGDRAPAITAKAADGRPLDLAALHGKFVLLAFWATYHQPTLASIPQLKATYDAFGRDPRLVIIGLNEDVVPETMRRYVAHHGLAWEQRYLGSGDYPNPIAAAFGVRYPAAVFLIGPDGRIIAKDLQGDAIQQAVARALR